HLLPGAGERGLQGVHPLVHLRAVVPAHDHGEHGLVLAHLSSCSGVGTLVRAGVSVTGAPDGPPGSYRAHAGSSHFGHNLITRPPRPAAYPGTSHPRPPGRKPHPVTRRRLPLMLALAGVLVILASVIAAVVVRSSDTATLALGERPDVPV